MTQEGTKSKRTYTRLDFSLENEEHLIDFVKQNPALFNPSNEHYKIKTYRDRLWEDFGATIDKSGDYKYILEFDY